MLCRFGVVSLSIVYDVVILFFIRRRLFDRVFTGGGRRGYCRLVVELRKRTEPLPKG
jgi:hypothetical protein